MTYATAKATDWTQTLTIDAVGNAKTVVAGEVFTIANVYACNPLTKARLPYLQQFVVITGGVGGFRLGVGARPVVDHLAPDHHLRRLSNRGVRGHVLDGSRR